MIFGYLRSLRSTRPTGICLLLLLSAVLAGQEALTPDQKSWLEDISPIITKIEREVFLKLRTRSERDKFMAFFWKVRDKTPDTAENEFKKEYEGRVRFADQTFGRESSKRGSQTDRGYYYLVLGPPLERHLFTTVSQIWPLELWFYEGAVEYGLPDHFYLIFYQPRGLGEYQLYYPGIEGPERLVTPQMSIETSKRTPAFQIIKKVDSALASASMSYLPGDQVRGMGSFSSDNIIASIKQLPAKQYSDAYANNYFSYKDYIDVEYADRYLASAFQAKVYKADGQSFLHWTIEPEKMSFGTQESGVYASFELVLRLETSEGLSIFERTEEIPLRLTAEQYNSHERQRFAFQDLLAVIPGECRALFLLKNKTAREFTSFEFRISVPEPGRPRLSSPLLFHGREALADVRKAVLRPFAFNGTQYLIGARNEFLPEETLGVYFQGWDLAGLKLAGPPSFRVELFSVDTGASLGTFPLSPEAGPGNDPSTVSVAGSLSLAGVKPGYYRAEVSALSPSGQKVLSDGENFIILAKPYPVLPWVYAKQNAPFPGPEHLTTLGGQYFLAKNYGRTRELLERVLRAKDDPASRLLLAKTLFALGLYRESLDQALPAYERTPDREAAKLIALDYAGLADWPSALGYLEKLMSEATEVGVLNLAAECYLNLDRPEKALPLIERSLSLVPDQPTVKALQDKTKKRLGR
jgi:GWxTD domain-containing protein